MLFFLIPYTTVFFNYGGMFFAKDNYLNNSDNILSSWFADSTYLLLVQLAPRLIIISLAMILNQILYNISSSNNKYNKRVLSSILIGLGLGFLMLFFDVNLFREHSYSYIEPIIYYALIGFLYGKYVYIYIDTPLSAGI